MSSNMISSSAATNATSSGLAEQRLSQTSTTVATPCRHASATTTSTDDLADFDYEVFQFRDSIEIARVHLGHPQTTALASPRRRESKREAFPFGRNSLDLARRDLTRARAQRERQQLQDLRAQVSAATAAHVFLRTLGSRFAEDHAAMMTDPVLDYELNHRDSLSLPREQRALTAAAARRNADKPAQRLVAKAKACSREARAALAGLAGKCFRGEADRTVEVTESKVGLLE